mgnify:CR=1 FL=1
MIDSNGWPTMMDHYCHQLKMLTLKNVSVASVVVDETFVAMMFDHNDVRKENDSVQMMKTMMMQLNSLVEHPIIVIEAERLDPMHRFYY